TLEIWGSFANTILDWDAYVVIMGNGKTWSVMPENTLKKGIYALVKKAMEMHYDYLVGYGFGPVRIFYMRVPSGASGYYTVYCAILPTGTKPTMNNARGPYSQLSIAGFQIIR
ncbi:MAG: hypothetical protein NT045_09685, partial [Candidatus Aureabacteria bacterium]|nr:hypothetical protein [Candidatus Auribacterota bacterium]